MMIFSRYLSADQFGLMSMTLIVCGFINIIRDLGLTAAIIQRENISEKFKSSVFYFNLIIGILLCIMVYSSSDIISSFFHQSDLIPILKVISFAFPINSFTSIHLSILERDSKFLQIAKCESFSSVLSLFLGVILAIYNFGVYSLVIQTLLYSSFSAFGFVYYSRWVPRSKFYFSEIKNTFSFSSNLVFFNFINYFSRNSDQAIIGRYFSAGILGQYSLAYKVMLFPLQNITYVLTRSLYPILSRNVNDAQYCLNLYLKTISIIILIVSPLMLGMASVSYDFVNVIFGSKWHLIPSILEWLAPTAILQSLISTTGAVFMSQNKTGLLVRLTIFNALLQISSFIIGAQFNVFVLIKLYFVANVIIFTPNLFFAVKCFNGRLVDIFMAIYKPLFLSVIMVVVIKFIIFIMSSYTTIPDVFRLVISVCVGVITYSLLVFFFDKKVFHEIRNRFKGGKKP